MIMVYWACDECKVEGDKTPLYQDMDNNEVLCCKCLWTIALRCPLSSDICNHGSWELLNDGK